ncbi:MAG: MFS transporter [Dehalococcoidia bacterium]|nr:MFS transporter [Dehalococcoidia bacterium]
MAERETLGRAVFDRYFVALRYRDFRFLWLANVTAGAAALALLVVRAQMAYDMSGHSSGQAGLTIFLGMVPFFIVPLFIGVLADRMDRRTLVAWTFVVNILQAVLMGVLVMTGTLTLWHLNVLAFVNGAAFAAQMPPADALVANLVPREQLLNALSLNAATRHGSRLIGVAITTPLIATVGVEAAFLTCAGLYGVGLVLVLMVRVRSTGGVTAGQKPMEAFRAGLAYALGRPVLRAIIILAALHCALTMAYDSLLPAMARQDLGSGRTGYNDLVMAMAAGALVAALWVGGVQSASARGKVLLATGVLSGVGLLGLATAPNMGVALLAIGIAGAAQGAFMTLVQAIIQASTEDAFRGRVTSFFVINIGGMMALISLTNGYLADVVNPSGIVFVSGLAFAAVMVFSLGGGVLRNMYLRGIPAPQATVPAHSH